MTPPAARQEHSAARRECQGETCLAAGAPSRPGTGSARRGRAHGPAGACTRVAVLSTATAGGRHATPGPGQIRSNGPMLVAQVCRAGSADLPWHRRGHHGISGRGRWPGREATCSCPGGGRPKLDLVPGVLEAAGVVAFPQVAMKPGKPVFFGTRPRDHAAPAGLRLPGNRSARWSVSSCLFDRRYWAGIRSGPRVVRAHLERTFAAVRSADLPSGLPGGRRGRPHGRARPWFGSPTCGGSRGQRVSGAAVGEHHYRAGTRYGGAARTTTGERRFKGSGTVAGRRRVPHNSA